MQPEQKSRQ